MSNQVLTLTNGKTIHYVLEHRQRRTVGLKITPNGLVVHAPKRIFAFQLNQILQDKSAWIIRKLQAREANQIEAIQWSNGENLLYLGQDIQLNIVHHTSNKALVLDANTLTLATPTPDNPLYIQRKVIHWFQKQAVLDFSRRLAILAAKLGVATPPFALSNAKTRWGSCNSRGEIRLSWRLLQAPPHIINYVICHELAHLKEMNHSAKFWAVVEKLFPNYKEAEKALKHLSLQLHRM